MSVNYSASIDAEVSAAAIRDESGAARSARRAR